MIDLKEITKKIESIDSEKLYTSSDVNEMEVFIDKFGKPSYSKVHRFFKSDYVKKYNVGLSKIKPRFAIKGKDLKNVLLQMYNLM